VPEPAEPDHDWVPAGPEPSGAELAAKGAEALATAPLRFMRRIEHAVEHPRTTARRVAESAQALGEIGWNFANPAPKVPLNVEVGPHRRFVWVRSDLGQFKLIKDALGGTVNDVVLAVVTGALREWLRGRGVRTEGLELRAQVPVSIRAEDERGHLGNRILAVRAPLPVYIDDPVIRLRSATEAMQGVKQSKQALGAEVISGLERFAPPTLLAQASRLNFSTRLFNLIVTNVPGPQFPLYLLGREMEQLVPIAFLPEDHALAIAIMSYNGNVDFGLLGDYDAMPDLDFVGQSIKGSLGELLRAAGATPSWEQAADVEAGGAPAPSGAG
jgi:diacylglycerol O-acyltransferase / wax synthase